jgi:hypothetical protein
MIRSPMNEVRYLWISSLGGWQCNLRNKPLLLRHSLQSLAPFDDFGVDSYLLNRQLRLTILVRFVDTYFAGIKVQDLKTGK